MYKVSKNKQNSKLATLTQIGLILATFGTVFFLYQAVATAVYGEIPPAYYQTLLVTENATNQTQGHAIDAYVENIKEQVCITIPNNQTAVLECLNL